MRTYDPVKRHEYYMKHRKLKGRRRAAKVKKVTKKKGSKKKAKKVTYKTRTSLEGLTPEQTTAAKEAQARIKIDKQEATKKINAEITAKAKELKASMAGKSEKEKAVAVELLKQQYSDIKKKVNDYYKELYAREVEKIKAK